MLLSMSMRVGVPAFGRVCCVWLVVLCAVCVSCQSSSPSPDGLLSKVLFSDAVVSEYGARCLDGTKAGLYYRAGSGKLNRFIIYLEGGAYCAGEADCIARSQTALGSNLYWPEQIPPHAPSDILSSNPNTNPYLHDWHAFYIPYCSGDLWLGNNTTPSPTSWNLTFAGNQIFWAAVQTLVNDYNLGNAEEVILTGVSAGGMGVFFHLDRFAAFMDELTFFQTRVVGVPQAGWFSVANSWDSWLVNPTAPYVPPVPDFATLYFVQVIVNYVPPPPCEIISEAAARYTCTFYIPGYYHHVHTPMFVAENLFDKFQIQVGNFVPAVSNSTVNSYYEYFGATMQASLTKYILKGWQRANALYTPACLEHELTFSGPLAVPVNGKTFEQSLVSWYKGHEITPAQRYAIEASPYPLCFGNQ